MSDKFKVIDRATFEKLQHGASNKTVPKPTPKIRNSKYKRMAATNDFNLMQFVKTKQLGKSVARKGKVRKRIIDIHTIQTKNRGKKRENGIKKPSRLKRSILQYRQMKREQALIEKELLKTESGLKDLKIEDDSGNGNRLVSGIHSSSFREYCNCCRTPDLKKHCEKLIRELNHFQRRAYAQNEIKARAHKRFVVGFRQVQAYLLINKIKLVVIATDCERNEGGSVSLDETVTKIKNMCSDQNVPIAFPFRRREMAYFLYKKASISCIGILDYDGAREIFAQLIESLSNAREMYNSLLSNKPNA